MTDFNVKNGYPDKRTIERLEAILASCENGEVMQPCIDGTSRPAFYFIKDENVDAFKEKLGYIDHVTFKLWEEKTIFLVKEEDLIRADIAANQLRAEKMPDGMIPRNILYDKANGKVEGIFELSKDEIFLFDHYAKAHGIQISMEGKDTILFDKKDAPIIHRISDSIAYDKSSKAWDILVRNRMFYDNARLLEDIYRQDMSPFYLVDDKGTVSYVTRNSFEISKEGSSIYIEKPPRKYKRGSMHDSIEDKRRRDEIDRHILRMDYPVKLTKEEYKAYQESEVKKDYLQSIRERNGYITLTENEKDILKEHERNRSFMEQWIRESSPNPDRKMTEASQTHALPEQVLKERERYVHTEISLSPRMESYIHEMADGQIASRDIDQIQSEYRKTAKEGMSTEQRTQVSKKDSKEYLRNAASLEYQQDRLLAGEEISSLHYQYEGQLTGKDTDSDGILDIYEEEHDRLEEEEWEI